MSKPKIAIIGAGIGGASASHFLTELLDGNLEIDIFESNEIGGRMATIKIGDNVYEAGGTILDSGNKYMKDFVKLLGLEERRISKPWRIGIWDGEKPVLTDNKWELNTKEQLLKHVNSTVSSLPNIYKHQDDGEAYDTVIDLISAMSPELSKLLHVSTAEYFRSLGYSDRVIDEVLKVALIGHYGHDTVEAHSLLGFLSVAGSGDPWSVTGGNKEVPTQLIYKNSRVNVVPSQVKAIRYLPIDEFMTQYEISYSNAGSNSVTKNIYDIVIIAAPLTKDQKHSIEFIGFPQNDSLRIPGNYQTIVATFVVGDLKLSHFGLEESIDTILSYNPKKTHIFYLSKLLPVDGPTGNDSNVWRIQSDERLTVDQISSLFSAVDQVQEVQWKAFPKCSATKRLDKFEFYDSLYYVNAIEWAASSMELSAIAGRNIALLINEKLKNREANAFAEGGMSHTLHHMWKPNYNISL